MDEITCIPLTEGELLGLQALDREKAFLISVLQKNYADLLNAVIRRGGGAVGVNWSFKDGAMVRADDNGTS